MKTAAEMRALNPKYAAKAIIDELERSILFATRQGWTEVRLSRAITHSERFSWIQSWINDIDCPMVESIIGELREAGYKVSDFYEEKQFVDMDIIISWDGQDDQVA